MHMSGFDSSPVEEGQSGFWWTTRISTGGLWAECSHNEQWGKAGEQREQVKEMESITTAGNFQPVFLVEILNDDSQ